MAVEDTKRRPEWGLSEPRSFCSTKSQIWKTVQRQKTSRDAMCRREERFKGERSEISYERDVARAEAVLNMR